MQEQPEQQEEQEHSPPAAGGSWFSSTTVCFKPPLCSLNCQLYWRKSEGGREVGVGACDPYHDGAVLRGAGDDMVIVRTPVHIQNWTCVTTHCRVGLINTTRLQREGWGGWGGRKIIINFIF